MRTLRSSLFVGMLMLSALATAQPAAMPDADRFFTDPALGETRALLVMQQGRIVYERYAPGYGPGNRFISWSMAKSVTSTLIGALVSDGRLELDSPAPVPAWRKPGDRRAAITLRHLLHMSSGLKHVETGPAPERSDTNRALFADRSGDVAAASVSAPLAAEPGTRFTYSTLTSHILSDILGRTVAPEAATPAARRQAVRRFMEERLTGPAAMPTLICEFDAAGTMLGGSMCHASLRDWGAFGQLWLDGGRVAGRQVVSQDWIRFVTTPAATDGGYGGHFWLNRPRPEGREDVLFPKAGPADAFGAVGHLGQYVVIAPSRQLVVVRLGRTPDARRAPLRAALGQLVGGFAEQAP